jgi:hypothetical protein
MYRNAVNTLLSEVEEAEEFFQAGIIAIDITEANPFTGDRTGQEDEIIGTKEKTDEYADQWAPVQLVCRAIPLVLDAPRYGKTSHAWKASRTCWTQLKTSSMSITYSLSRNTL